MSESSDARHALLRATCCSWQASNRADQGAALSPRCALSRCCFKRGTPRVCPTLGALLHAGTVEYAIAEDRVTAEGNIWEPQEKDVTLDRQSSTPFHITPYTGKYG